MKIDLVWIIYKSNSQSAKEEVKKCMESLKEHKIEVITAEIGKDKDPFPKRLNKANQIYYQMIEKNYLAFNFILKLFIQSMG